MANKETQTGAILREAAALAQREYTFSPRLAKELFAAADIVEDMPKDETPPAVREWIDSLFDLKVVRKVRSAGDDVQ